MLVLPNGFAAEDAVVLAFDPNSPPAGVEAGVFVWPKGLPESPVVAGLPKENVGLGFAGSDMLFEDEAVPLGLGDLSARDLRRRRIGLGSDMLSCREWISPHRKGREGGANLFRGVSLSVAQVGNPVVVASQNLPDISPMS